MYSSHAGLAFDSGLVGGAVQGAVVREAGFGGGTLFGVCQNGFYLLVGLYQSRFDHLLMVFLRFGVRLLGIMFDAYFLRRQTRALGKVLVINPLAVTFGII